MRTRKLTWLAGAAAGSLVFGLAPRALAGTSTITINGASGGVNDAATGTTSVSVTVTKTGSVNNPTGQGIAVSTQQGAVTILTNGPVTGTTSGIVGQVQGSAPDSVTANANVTGGVGNGVSAIDSGNGLASVSIGSGTTKAPILITNNGANTGGASAFSALGTATTTLGANDSITSGLAGQTGAAAVDAIAGFTMADVNGPSAQVTMGTNDTIVFQGNGGAAVTAHTGFAGMGPDGSASAAISIGNGISLHASGLDSAGVIGFVADPSGANAYGGTGNVNVSIGTGAITVDEVGATGTPTGTKTSVGVAAISAGGSVMIDDAAKVNVSGGADTSVGLLTTTTEFGTSLINARTSVTSLNGDAIRASTVNGANTINVLGGAVSATAGDGIDAISTGAGAINITTAAGTDVATTTPGAFSGIAASGNTSAISIITKGTVSNGGITATTGGSGSITIQTTGAVTNTAGNDITATALNGPVNITTSGPIAASGDGVFVQGSGLGGVSVNIGGNVTAAGGFGVTAQNANIGPGSDVVTTANGTAKDPLTVSTPGTGIQVVSFVGPAVANIGSNNTFDTGTPGTGGAAVLAVNVFAPFDIVGVPSAEVTTGVNDTFNVNANVAAAIVAQVGVQGAEGPTNGTASAVANVGNGVNIHVSGLADAGVIGFVTDISTTPVYFGFGNVSITVGTGSILVDEVGAIGSGGAINNGIAAISGGGDITVDDSAQVTVLGGLDTTRGIGVATGDAGTSLINARASITSTNGEGIFASTGGGANTVNVLGGKVSATGGDGIQATGSGAITITTAAGTDVATTTPGSFAGIDAGGGGGGAISIVTKGTVSNGGVLVTNASGLINIQTFGAVTNTAGAGVSATSNSGPVTITTNGAVTAANGSAVIGMTGVAGVTGGTDTVSVTVNKSVSTTGAFAIEAFDNGSGAATVTTGPGTSASPLSILSPGGGGVETVSIFGDSAVNIGNWNTISVGAPGQVSPTDALSIALLAPTDTGGVSASRVSLGSNDTVSMQGDGGDAVVSLVGLPTIPLGPNGDASSSIVIGNNVSIHTSGLGNNGVFAAVTDTSGHNSYSGSGNVSITVGTGSILVDELSATAASPVGGLDLGIAAVSSGGDLLIDDAARVTVLGNQDVAVGLLTSTTGAGTSTINARAAVTASNGAGILATTQNGANTINVLGNVAATGSAVTATATGAGAVTITTAAGTTVGTSTPGAFGGIVASSGSGAVIVNAAGTVSNGGISATSGNNSVSVTAAGVTNTAGDGIDATSQTGGVTIGTTGPIVASGNGVVGTTQGLAGAAITVGQSVQAAGMFGAYANDQGAGSASVTTVSGTAKAPLTISDPTDVGVLAVTAIENASVTIGDHNTITAGVAGGAKTAGVDAYALLTYVGSATPAAQVTTGIDDSFTLLGNNGAAVVAQDGLAGNFGLPISMASVAINIGNGVAIHASGLSDAGVIGFVVDPSGANTFAGAGDVSVTVGTGSILVDELNASGTPSGAVTNVGVGALSAGGNVLVDDAATVTVIGGQDASVGLVTKTSGSGTSTINARASVTSMNGDAIRATTVGGANSVSVLGGAVSATGGDGIDATAASGGVSVTTSASTTVGTLSPGAFAGILATSAGGPVTIDAAGAVTDGGVIATTSGGGSVSVTAAAVTNSNGIGIQATGSGAVTVNALGKINASGAGIDALGRGLGLVSVMADSSIQSGGLVAVVAENLGPTTGGGTVQTASGSSKGNPLTISGAGQIGLEAVSILGPASVLIGANNNISAGSPGQASVAGAVAIDIFAPADLLGVPSAEVITGTNDSFTVQGNNGAGISAQIGQAGVLGPSGSASVLASIGNGVSIHISGLSDAGVVGFNSDPSGLGLFNGTGNISLTVGTGTIVVNETGATGPLTGAKINAGVAGLSSGGNVLVDDSAVVTASGGQDISRGLSAITAANGSATIDARASVTSLNGDGIFASTQNGAITISQTAGKISGSADGIDAVSSTGAINIATAAGTFVTTTTPASSAAIFAKTSGTVSVNAMGTVSDGGVAVTGGSASVTVAKVTNTAADGVDVTTTTGDATLLATGPINAADLGLDAFAFNGDATITANASVTAGAGGAAVDSEAFGAATAITGDGTSSARLAFKAGASGIAAVSIGDPGIASVQIGDFNTITAGAAGLDSTAGVFAESVSSSNPGGAASANVVLGTGDTITVKGNDAQGVAGINFSGAASGTGSVSIHTGSALSVHVSGFAVAGVLGASALPAFGLPGAGDVSVVVGGGTVTVDESGAIGTAMGNFGLQNIGVGAISAGGNVLVDDSAVVNATGGASYLSVGLLGDTSGAGTSTVDARANVTSHQGDGIDSFTGGGSNTVNVYAAISAPTGAAVNAQDSAVSAVGVNVLAGASVSGGIGINASSVTGAVSVDNTGTVIGGSGGGVVLASGGPMTLTNELSGVLTAPGASNSPTISVSGAGLLTLDNLGAIGTNLANHSGSFLLDTGAGGVNFTNAATGTLDGTLTGSGNLTLNNLGTWQTRGTSDFGNAANAATNTLNNDGTIIVGMSGPTGAASAASFLDLGAFNNGSASAVGNLTMMNGKVGDTLTVSGLFTGAAGNSNLFLDVFLGKPGSKADELILQGGSAGQTLITVNDTNTGAGAANSKGIVLVTGASSASNFALNPNQPGYDPVSMGIDKGLLTYPLMFKGGTEELVGLPGQSAMQMSTMASAAEDVWSATTPGDESAASLRLSLAGGDDDVGSTGGDGPRLWAKAINGGPSRLNRGSTLMGQANFASDGTSDVGAPIAGLTQQSQTESAFGMTYGFDTSYSQNVSALLTGLDLGRHVGQSEAWSWGISTGYLESQQSFTSGAALASYQGALAAVHGAYVNTNGFYVAGDAKLTALQVDYTADWPGAGHPTSSITTFGGEADGGWKRSLSANWTLEPNASVSMQSSRLGDLSVAGTEVRFGDANSVRLGVGAKLEGAWRVFGLAVKNETSLKLWDELEGANTLDLGDPTNGFTLPDQIGGVFTDASEAISLESADGKTSAFVSGAYRWKSDYSAAQLSTGFKLRW